MTDGKNVKKGRENQRERTNSPAKGSFVAGKSYSVLLQKYSVKQQENIKKTPGNPGSFLFSELFHHSSIIGNNGSPTLISVPSGSAKGLKSALKLSGSTPREASILRAVAGVSGYMASPIRRRHSRVV